MLENKFKHHKTTIKVDSLELGESIETKMRRVTQTNEPIENVAPMIYTERKEGVLPQYDIRTDRWDIAQKAMGAVEKSIKAKRENKPAEAKKEEPAEPTE